MKAILTGTIAGGFGIAAVVPDEQAEDIVLRLMADGKLAEAMDIEDPTTLDKRATGDANGDHFIVFGKGIGNAFLMVGPFADEETAEEFGEAHRADDDEWELFTFARTPTPQPIAGFEQHEIDAQIESAFKTKARHGYTASCVVCKKWVDEARPFLGFHFEENRAVGDVAQHEDGTYYQVLAIV